MADIEDLKPCPASYGPKAIEGLEPGEVKYWCSCGLSKSQPFCDGSHKGTGMKPLAWKVPEGAQKVYYFCQCKYAKSKPLCDGSHNNLPMIIKAQIENCPAKAEHEGKEYCVKCGYHI